MSFHFKLLMLGDKSVGKTTLSYRYVTGTFKKELKQTIGVDIFTKFIKYQEKAIKFQIWDFGGERRFRSIVPRFCEGANAALLLYDITNEISYHHLSEWIHVVNDNAGEIPIILIGTKKDLNSYREVSLDKGYAAVEEFNLTDFFEVSSKTGTNLEKAFRKILDLLFEEIEY
ncbi:MAG: GTP-binding protein [Candidatus Lokiarchaeota archaeon]|nr:GTP-binding protein [Candidatus Lokiarchaeota archaeon]MBD3199753.1 GTP-binding protein [Candidatus Lokiarchaeota archaeon]